MPAGGSAFKAEPVRRHGIYSRDGFFDAQANVCFRPIADIRFERQTSSMSSVPATKHYAAYVVLWTGFVLAIPLWREFHEPGQPFSNVFTPHFLVGLVLAAYFRSPFTEEQSRGGRSSIHRVRYSTLL